MSEIKDEWARLQLHNILQDHKQPVEIRAGAAWALGEIKDRAVIPSLINTFSELHEPLRREATKALVGLLKSSDAEEYFLRLSAEQRPGFAWAFSRSKAFSLEEVLRVISDQRDKLDEDIRHWVSYMIGMQNQKEYITKIEKLKEIDPEIYFAVNVLWTIMASWIHRLEEY